LYASPEGLGQSFSFDMLMCPYNAAKYKETIDESLKQVKNIESSTTWVLSNHDVSGRSRADVIHKLIPGDPTCDSIWYSRVDYRRDCRRLLEVQQGLPAQQRLEAFL
jgi:hypothetical protein